MMNKKAQGSFILRVFSILAYIIALMFVLILLNIPGCNNKDEVQRTIDSDSKVLVDLRAAEQLSAYLRTDMPSLNELESRIDNLEGKSSLRGDSAVKGSSVELTDRINVDDTKMFLRAHPEVYQGKTYGEFISALYAYRNDNAENVFNTVTRALFIRELLSEGQKKPPQPPERYDLYTTPNIGIKFDNTDIRDADDADVWSSVDLLLNVKGAASKLLPTQDGTVITVKLFILSLQESLAEPIP